jgi:sulfopyruvate decarboxylase TPP-binding subunit
MEPQLAQQIVTSLRDAGIDFMSYLPESRMSQILPLMRGAGHFKLAPAASEADAVSVAVGATLAGKQSACYMESTAFMSPVISLSWWRCICACRCCCW